MPGAAAHVATLTLPAGAALAQTYISPGDPPAAASLGYTAAPATGDGPVQAAPVRQVDPAVTGSVHPHRGARHGTP